MTDSDPGVMGPADLGAALAVGGAPQWNVRGLSDLMSAPGPVFRARSGGQLTAGVRAAADFLATATLPHEGPGPWRAN